MLDRAYMYKEVIDDLCSNSRLKIYARYAISTDEWATAKVILDFLGKFRDASTWISGEKYPTLSTSLFIYITLVRYIEKFQASDTVKSSTLLTAGLDACKEKLFKFFDISTFQSELYYFAAFLDPRFKDTLFKNHVDLFDEEWTSGCMKSLIEDLQGRREDVLPLSATPKSTGSLFSSLFGDDLDLLGTVEDEQQGESVEQEIFRYLSVPRLDKSSDPLGWWRSNQHGFPTLAKAARDYLVIPGSSVMVERSLNTGRDMISLRRTSMSAETIKQLMLYRALLLFERNDK